LNPCAVHPGETLDLHVLVRNLGVGHTFPGGTIDSNEVWLEVIARDGAGRIFYHHGDMQANGDVDPAAHFYKAVLLDRSAQLVNKRNVHDWVSTLYVRTIPPGAADVARYRLTMPKDAGDRITIEVKLCYRKFFNWFSKFVFSGQREPGQTARIDQYVDESRWNFSNAPVPALPIIDVADTRVTIPVEGSRVQGPGSGVTSSPSPSPSHPLPLSEDVVKRLNAYGIGLLLQKDTKSAWTVMETLTARAPQFVEGHINLARTQLAEGSLDEAEATLRRVLGLEPDYPKALYLLGKINRERGGYQQALELFQRVASRYPNDRILCNEIAQLYFLTDRYREAIAELERVLAIDPENLAAHYYLMLSYNALGESEKAREIEARYLRYKPDESITYLAGQYRLRHPEASLEAQPVHVHE
jgi:tetratricopeptide (TPR) repeat protein